jgi:hypothetical protein
MSGKKLRNAADLELTKQPRRAKPGKRRAIVEVSWDRCPGDPGKQYDALERDILNLDGTTPENHTPEAALLEREEARARAADVAYYLRVARRPQRRRFLKELMKDATTVKEAAAAAGISRQAGHKILRELKKTPRKRR